MKGGPQHLKAQNIFADPKPQAQIIYIIPYDLPTYLAYGSKDPYVISNGIVVPFFFSIPSFPASQS